ncbi:DUF4157 domain-containing protein [Actinomadura sp. 9N215]|uniref:DUF4157 domain-containing protein n=1 Tax=Actinomadura sp. 9N215 TaxID=3375150 RepID=UPI00379D1535
MREQKDRRDDGKARRTPADAKQRARTDEAMAKVVPGAAPSPGSVMALQRLVGNAAVARMVSAQRQADQGSDEPGSDEHAPAVQRQRVEKVLRSSGRPMEEPVRAEIEARTGASLGHVRVHTDANAHQAAESLHAEAFTSGSDIAFRRGNYDPHSTSGMHLIMHEALHAIDNQTKPATGFDNGQGLLLTDPAGKTETDVDAESRALLSKPLPH